MAEADKVVAAVAYARERVTLSSDNTLYARIDYWMDPRGVLYYEAGDSEDFAFFVHSLLLNGNVPGSKLRTYFGYKDGVAYSWVTYKRASDGQWVILDAPAGAVTDVNTLGLAEEDTHYHSAYAYLTNEAYVVIPPGEYLSTYTTNDGVVLLVAVTVEGRGGAVSGSALPVLVCSGTGKISRVGSAAGILPVLSVSSSGRVSIFGSGSITWKSIVVASAGYGVPVGTATMALPGLSAYCSGVQALFDDDYVLRFQ